MCYMTLSVLVWGVGRKTVGEDDRDKESEGTLSLQCHLKEASSPPWPATHSSEFPQRLSHNTTHNRGDSCSRFLFVDKNFTQNNVMVQYISMFTSVWFVSADPKAALVPILGSHTAGRITHAHFGGYSVGTSNLLQHHCLPQTIRLRVVWRG